MRLGICGFFILCFSLEGKADLFSSGMSLKEKVKLTRQLGEQTSNRHKSLSRSRKPFLHKKPTLEKQRVSQPVNSRINYPVKQVYVSKKDQDNIRMILGLPLENRKQALSRYHSFSFHVLKQFVFSKKEEMSIRWKALTSIARLHPEEAYPVVQEALRNDSWFLRNAGLIAMEIINSEESVRWAGEFLNNDPSLVVRTAAVAMIKKYKARQYKIYLLGKLNAPDSFHKRKSLWIRHHIVSALADFSEPGEEKMFISFLHDPDPRLHPSAIAALEKLTGKTFRSSEEEREIAAEKEDQKHKWISWWSEARYKKGSAQL